MLRYLASKLNSIQSDLQDCLVRQSDLKEKAGAKRYLNTFLNKLHDFFLKHFKQK